jgi:hypothetical protein
VLWNIYIFFDFFSSFFILFPSGLHNIPGAW